MKNQKPWYLDRTLDGDNLIDALIKNLNECKDTRGGIEDRWAYNEAMAGVAVSTNSSYPHIDDATFRRITYRDGRLRYNVIRSVIDAMVAQEAANTPKVRYITDMGSYQQRENARLRTRFIKGIFSQSNISAVALDVRMNSMVYGFGAARPKVVGNRIVFECLRPRTIYFDEPQIGYPEVWFHVEEVSKWKLIEEFPDKEDIILDASSFSDQSTNDYRAHRQSDTCTAVEAWYSPETRDGLHVKFISTGLLEEVQEWNSDRPGIVVMRYKTPLSGFIGESVVDESRDIQTEINFILLKVQEQMNMGCFKIVVEAAGEVGTEKITNKSWEIIRVMPGSNVQVLQLPSVDDALWAQLDRLESKLHQLQGVSELFAESNQPAGLESGEAVRQWEGIRNKRFIHRGQQYQQWFLDAAKAACDLARSVGMTVHVDNRDIQIDDIEDDEDRYSIVAVPTNVLPDSPSGQTDKILGYSQFDANLAADMISVLEDADLASFLEKEIAAKRLVQKHLDGILYDHEYSDPDQFIDLTYAKRQTVEYVQLAKLRDDDVAETMLMRYYSDLMDIEKYMVEMQQQIQAANMPSTGMIPAMTPSVQQQVPDLGSLQTQVPENPAGIPAQQIIEQQ